MARCMTTSIVLLLVVCTMRLVDTTQKVLDIRINNARPRHMDTYLCVAYKVPKGFSYIVKYEPKAEMNVVHHMFLHGCGKPYMMEHHAWNCQSAPSCPGGNSAILYAWGKNAGSLELPANTGMHVGGSSGYNYFVLQLHYLHVDSFKDGHTDNSGVTVTLDRGPMHSLAGIYLVAGANTFQRSVPARVKNFHMDAGCVVQQGPTFHAFRFRVHTHSLGSVVTGYRVRDGRWTLIGRGDPQKPQAFYPFDRKHLQYHLDIQPGDALMMRCTYNSPREYPTSIGPTHKDEMCNFYIMYYYTPTKGEETVGIPCYSSPKVQELKDKYPSDTDVPLDEVSSDDAPLEKVSSSAEVHDTEDNIERLEKFVEDWRFHV